MKKLSTFRRGFISTFSLDVTGRGLTAVGTIGFIRALDVGDFAYLVLFLTIGQFAGLALTGGVRMRYMRTEAERVSRGAATRSGFTSAASASALLVFGVSVVAFIAVAIVNTIGSAPAGEMLFVALASAYTAANAGVELAMFHYQAHLQFARAGWIGVARGLAILAVAIGALCGLVDTGPLAAALVLAAVSLVALVVCIPLVRRTFTSIQWSAVTDDLGRESGWLTLYYFATSSFAFADLFIVAAFLSDQAVASYGAALRYIAIIAGPLPALVAVLRVRTSQGDIVDSPTRQGDMLSAWIRRAFVPGTAIIGAAALAAPFVIPWLDKGRYPDSVPIFEAMLVATYVDYLTLPAANLMMSGHRYRTLAGFYLGALAVQLLVVGGVASMANVVAVAAVASGVGALEASSIALLARHYTRRDAEGEADVVPETAHQSP